MRVLVITNLAVSPGGGGVFTSGIVNSLRQLGNHVEVVACQRRENLVERIQSFTSMLLVALLFGVPFKVAYYCSLPVLARIIFSRGKFDRVMLDHLEVCWILFFKRFLPKRISYISHNDEAKLLLSKSSQAAAVAGKPIWNRLKRNVVELARAAEFRRTERFQNKVLHDVEEVFSISDELDEKKIASISRIYPGFSYQSFGERRPAVYDSPPRLGLTLGFLGNLSWWPNVEGLSWFLESVVPFLNGSIRINIYGPGKLPDACRALADSRVTFCGFADKLDDVWINCDLMIAPIRFGAGANVKFAEYLYNQKPVMATEFVAKQYAELIRDEKGIYLGSSAEWWIDALNRLGSGEESLESPSAELGKQFSLYSLGRRLEEDPAGRVR